MPGKRTKNFDLPKRLAYKHGSYYLLVNIPDKKTCKWVNLGQDREYAVSVAENVDQSHTLNPAQIESAYGINTWVRENASIPDRCVYCGASENLLVDHFIPRSKGGGDAPGNLVVCCNSCNLGKGNKDPIQVLMRAFNDNPEWARKALARFGILDKL